MVFNENKKGRIILDDVCYFFLLVHLYIFVVGTKYSFCNHSVWYEKKIHNETFSFIVEQYGGYHICIDPIVLLASFTCYIFGTELHYHSIKFLW